MLEGECATIVKNEGILQQAMDLLKVGPVRYQDHYTFATVADARKLETMMRAQIENDDIAIVALLGREKDMESYDYEIKNYRRERRVNEQRATRRWVTEHPEQARKYMERLYSSEQEKVLEANR